MAIRCEFDRIPAADAVYLLERLQAVPITWRNLNRVLEHWYLRHEGVDTTVNHEVIAQLRAVLPEYVSLLEADVALHGRECPVLVEDAQLRFPELASLQRRPRFLWSETKEGGRVFAFSLLQIAAARLHVSDEHVASWYGILTATVARQELAEVFTQRKGRYGNPHA